MPTYHDSSLYWGGALTINFTSAADSWAPIWMKEGLTTTGPGFVGGNISQGANKGTSNGVPGIVVFLRNAQNRLIASSVTDGNGDYSFTSIPSGIYNVYPEDMGLATTPSSNLTVYSSGQTSVTDVDFIRNSSSIVPVALSISEVDGSNAFNVYPNPARAQLNINSTVSAEATITNAIGAKVLIAKVSRGDNKIDVSNLSAGLYLIKISNGTEVKTQKLVIEK